jgi:hypothetical protein
MGVALGLALLLLFAAHVALVAGLLRRRAYGRAAAALVLPPLAPFWGGRLGLRRTVYVWGAALGLYTLLELLVAARAFFGLAPL